MIASSDRFNIPTRSAIPAYLRSNTYAVNAFAQEVETALEAQTLYYSSRQKLVKRATHFGINRFDANLVIAMVQHRVERSGKKPAQKSGRSSLMPIIAIVAVLQSLILAAGWFLFS